MTTLDTLQNEALRRRFGWMAERVYRTNDEKDGEPEPRKKGAEPERKSTRREQDAWYFLAMWALVNCRMSHLTMN